MSMANTGPLSGETMMLDLRKLQQEKITGRYFTVTVIEGPDFGCVFQLEKDETVVGRKDDGKSTEAPADIQLNDVTASRRHIVFAKRQLGTGDNALTSFVVIDLGRTNGTFVNHHRVSDRKSVV